MGEYMTKEGYETAKKKLAEMKQRRPIISKAIGEAREHGDLKENSAYHAAKEEQGLNEMRIRDLEARLEGAIVVDKSKIKQKDTVTLGSVVKIKDIKSGKVFEYTIVSAVEADILEDKISPDSPIGSAVIRAKKGEVVEVDAPKGIIKYKIIEIN
ncbi:MAG: transcription elongation factor GreA [bacterium]|nr:transcription elongation factor GreA [Candidatus Margulisiibacteriota bacterium]